MKMQKNMGYCLRKEVMNLPIYKAGKPISEVKRELGLDEVIKLASNENPLGCSFEARKVLADLVSDAQLYPDASNFELKSTLAGHFNVAAEQIFCSTGSDALIKVISSAFLNPGDETIMAEVTFPRYEASASLMGAKSIKVPMKDNGLDLKAMVDCINERTKIMWLCNPNNPTGTIFTQKELDDVIKNIPENVIIVMDEAYVEYVMDGGYPDTLSMLNDYPNMIILRTFSKAYGLAGLRIGYGIANKELVQYFNAVIGPFDVNLFAQKAAVAALMDNEFIKRVRKVNSDGKEYLYKEFEALGLPYVKTSANFIMVNTERDDKEIFDKLLKKGIIIRPGYLLGMPGWMRVTIGTDEQNKKFIDALGQCL